MTDTTSRLAACYGQHGSRAECRRCPLRGYCRGFAENIRNESSSRFCSAGQYAELVPAPPEEPAEETAAAAPEEPVYTRTEMLLLLEFFLQLTPIHFMILKLRLLRPEMTNRQIARQLQIGEKRIYKFFREVCRSYPAMRDILPRVSTKES